MWQNAFGQSDCRIHQSAISQEKSERPSRFFVCKLTSKFPTRKYYCVDMGDQGNNFAISYWLKLMYFIVEFLKDLLVNIKKLSTVV